MRASGLVRRIGVNLNQAVAKLNATGQRSGDLLPYAAESFRRAERLDAVRKKSGRLSGDRRNAFRRPGEHSAYAECSPAGSRNAFRDAEGPAAGFRKACR